MLTLTQSGHAQEAGEPAPAPAPAAATLAGEYVHREMELVAGLRLGKDGQFLFGLIVGSLDQEARGRWETDGKRIRLISDPRPVAPVITASRVEARPGRPFAIRLLGPTGRDVPGVDLRIEFDDGAPLDSYMPGEPWSLPEDEKRVPRFVTFSIPSHQIAFPRMPIESRPGTTAVFDFTPNDFGVVDLTDAVVTVEGDTLTLTYPLGTLRMKRTGD
ncbi:hypothetical protein [Sphingomonas sp.]|uniref:hypothetical protein n=1 Tax=Sphingomonas sp. TaxID=28214 RepID=UPI0031DBF8D3